MIELIKQLAKEGFRVRVIEVEQRDEVHIALPPAVASEIMGYGGLKKEKKEKRVNWKTIKKIKEAKDDGLSSIEAAKDLNLPLKTVNKYWA